MRIANLWAKITIQSRVSSTDSYGQPSTTWQDYLTTFADLRHQRGMESVKADAPTSIVKASFRINRPPSLNITAGMRVVWESAAYDITAVLPQERNRYLDIVAERIGGLLIGD